MVTDVMVAVNDAVEAPALTMTLEGTETALLLLAKATLMPPAGAALDKLTEQVSESAPVIEVLPHEIPLTVGATAMPVPLMLTEAVGALLEIVNCPVVDVALVGSN